MNIRKVYGLAVALSVLMIANAAAVAEIDDPLIGMANPDAKLIGMANPNAAKLLKIARSEYVGVVDGKPGLIAQENAPKWEIRRVLDKNVILRLDMAVRYSYLACDKDGMVYFTQAPRIRATSWVETHNASTGYTTYTSRQGGKFDLYTQLKAGKVKASE